MRTMPFCWRDGTGAHAHPVLPAAGREIARVTRGLRGGFFSATLTPLPAMKRLLGGEGRTPAFRSLRRLIRAIWRWCAGGEYRYDRRESTAEQIADALCELTRRARAAISPIFPAMPTCRWCWTPEGGGSLPPLLVQRRDMEGDEQGAFLEAFEKQTAPDWACACWEGCTARALTCPASA